MSTYPDVRAGQRITAALLRSLLPEITVKESTTERASTTTMADDPELTTQLEAGAIYEVVFHLFPASISAADLQTAWTVPSGAAGFKTILGPGSSASDSNADNIAMRAGSHVFGTAVLYNGVRNNNSSAVYAREEAILTTVSAGTLALSWAQGTSSATASKLFAGSWLSVRRIG